MTQKEYISNWHRLFVNNVNGVLGYITGRYAAGNLTNESREKLSIAKAFLEGDDIKYVENDLSKGCYSQATLDKVERVYVKIAEFFIDMTVQDKCSKQIMKDFAHRYEHYQKDFTRLQLEALLDY